MTEETLLVLRVHGIEEALLKTKQRTCPLISPSARNINVGLCQVFIEEFVKLVVNDVAFWFSSPTQRLYRLSRLG